LVYELGQGDAPVDYKGEFSLKMIEPGIWKYRFQIGRAIKTGRTKATLEDLAIRSLHTRIDRELKLAGLNNAKDVRRPRTKS
jgi:hypothetical protein